MTNGSLMKVKSIAECSRGLEPVAPRSLHQLMIGLEKECPLFHRFDCIQNFIWGGTSSDIRTEIIVFGNMLAEL